MRTTTELSQLLRRHGACGTAREWVAKNAEFSPEQIYGAIQRMDWMLWLLQRAGETGHAFHFSKLLEQHRTSGYWLQLEQRRLVHRQLCDLVRSRVPFATIAQGLKVRALYYTRRGRSNPSINLET